MADEVKVRCRNDSSAVGGVFWFMGWLFTIGYLKLTFVKGLLGLLIWPYYLGMFFHK